MSLYLQAHKIHSLGICQSSYVIHVPRRIKVLPVFLSYCISDIMYNDQRINFIGASKQIYCLIETAIEAELVNWRINLPHASRYAHRV